MTLDPRSDAADVRDDETDIAVIGMAGRFPGARDLAQFWSNIAGGVESISVLTDEELAAAGVPASIRQSPDYVPATSRLENADRFDAAFFGYSPREAALMDPQSRVCLELAWHAIEDAGYCSFDHTGSIGVFAAASLNTYLLQNLAGRLDAQDFVLGLGNIPIVLGNGPDFVATRVSYKLNLRGPSVAVQTACSSSLTAIHLARQSLLSGECDLALAGGVSIYLPQDRGYRWQEGMILSSDGHCRAFDGAADGIVFGRGGGMVLLKSLARALEDGDRIRAVIKGSAANNDGSRKVGFTAPSVAGQSRVIAEALADAGLRADSISYVEAHGTGTTLGDPIEIAGLTEAFRKHTTRTGYCAIGTVKTNIGHLDVAAGVTAFIKTVLMLEHRQLPPSLHFNTPNPAIDFATSPFYVNTSLRPWEGVSGHRRAGVSAFGIGGTNVHLIVEEAKSSTSQRAASDRPMHVMRITARTPDALGTLVANFADHMGRSDAPAIGDACFTANTGRAHHAHRVVVRAVSGADLRQGLASAASGSDDPRVVRGHCVVDDSPPVAFLFTGLGAQTIGMGESLFHSQPVFRAALERCDALLRPHVKHPLLSVLYPNAGESSPIDETTYGQPVMFAFEYALTMLWQSWGVRPAAVLGHSLGEYAGACVSGLLPLDEALRLVSTRARLADTLPPGGGMAAAFASEQQVLDAIGDDATLVSIASVNGPESIVMSGATGALTRVAARLTERGVDVRILNVTQAFHSGMLDPVLDEYERAVAQTRFGRAEIPIISNVSGGVLSDANGRDPRYWRRHARDVVRFADGVRTLYDRGIRHFLEMGPHTTATAMAAGCVPDEGAVFLPSLRRGRDDSDQLFESLSELYVRGVDVDWAGFDAPFERRRVSLPLYPFARTRHWIDAAPASALPASDGGPPARPMLGRAVQSPLFSEPAYDLKIDSDAHPFLDDHRIFGAVVFPATGYIEAALESVEQTTGRRATVVEDVEMAEPLASRAGHARAAQLILKPEVEGFGFEVFSQPRDEAAGRPWTRHGTGRVRTDAVATLHRAAPLDVDAIRARCGRERSGADYYGELADQGFGYGALFNGIQSVAFGDGEVLGEVRLPVALEDDAAAYQFHPALLDSCLQVVLGLAPHGRTFLPLRIDRAELGEWNAHLFVHAVARPATHTARAIVCDVRVANERGRVVAVIEGVALHETTRQRWAANHEWEQWLYEVAWRSAPLPATAGGAAVGGNARRVLIFDNESRVGARLAQHLGANGDSVAIVSTGAIGQDVSRIMGTLASGAQLDAVILLAGAAPSAPTADSPDPTTGTKLLLSLVQQILARPASASARLWVVTHGAQSVVAGDEVPAVFDAPMWGLANVISLEHPELRCSCIDMDGEPDASADLIWRELSAATSESKVAYRGGARYVARLTRAALPTKAARSADAMRRLESSDPGVLDALRYIDEPRRRPAPGEVEILVRAAGLNFKDVLAALGKYPGPAGALGHECAGEIVSVGRGVTEFAIGDAVVAFTSGSLATHVVADARLVARMPAALSFEEGATIAGGFLTAQYALHELAKIGPDDRILIHAATGGVGLAAVQIAQRTGATIFATAGSDTKRAMLKNLGLRHVFSSRNTEFAAEIEALTEGRGVTVVLNSLTGEMLERSISVLADGGRFVELGLENTPSRAGRDRLSGSAVYFNPNVVHESLADPARFGRLLRDVLAAVDRRELASLPAQVFDAEDAILAFRLMARAGHVGKVVVRQSSLNGAQPAADRISPNATYLIVGGLGGLGLLVAEWLAVRGARHLALMSRRDPGADEAAALAKLADRGVQVVTIRGDVSRRSDVAAAMARIADAGPPLRGVIQAAGVLDDGVIAQQTWERFMHVMAPKVAGSWNLHEAVAGIDLDFFVLFSSVASLLGSKGQGNHAAANAFLDALAVHRRARGVPALSINWGAWSNVGAAARRNIARRIASTGWGEIAPAQGIAVLEHVLGWPRPQIGAAPIDWPVYRQQFAEGQTPLFFSELLSNPPRAAVAPHASTESAGLAERVRVAAPGERRAIIAAFVRDQVAKGLGLVPSQHIDGDLPLAALGVDSLLAVELRNALNRSLGLARRLPATVLFDFPSISALTEHLLATIVDPVPSPAAIVSRPLKNVDERDIAELTDEEAEALLLEELQ